MGKGKKAAAPWLVVLQSVGSALAMYLVGVALLAGLMVRGSVPQSAAWPVMAVLCLGAAFAGGMVSARRLPWGTLPSALLAAGCFGAVLALAGLGGWDTLTLMGRGGGLLLCTVVGGVLAGLLGGRRKVRRKRK